MEISIKIICNDGVWLKVFLHLQKSAKRTTRMGAKNKMNFMAKLTASPSQRDQQMHLFRLCATDYLLIVWKYKLNK